MNLLSTTAFSEQLPQLAARQLADLDARQPGSLFAEGLTLDVAQGYALQSAVAELRCARGEQVVGYKVGCTSPTIREQLGIDHRVTGHLYDTEQHASGVKLSRSDFANLAIEGELAVVLAHEPSEEDFSAGIIPACVARVLPVIELHHYVMRGAIPSAGELIAHNAIHAGVVAGEGVPREAIHDEISLEIFVDDQIVESCEGPALIETIHDSLKWLLDIVQDRGERLRAGQVILTGSIPRLIPIAADCQLRVETSICGRAEATFAEGKA